MLLSSTLLILVRDLGIMFDNQSNFKEELEKILFRMAFSIKILKDLGSCFPMKTLWVALLNALFLGDIQYLSLMHVGISKIS